MFYSRLLANKGSFKSDYVGEEIVNLLDTTFYMPAQVSLKQLEVTAEYTARPDLLAMDTMGDDFYEDLICKINGFSNPLEIKEGMFVMIPDLATVNEYIVTPNPKYTETESVPANSSYDDILNIINGNKPVSKAPVPADKNSKRKPNQAVLGDKRFYIDQTSKIVIY